MNLPYIERLSANPRCLISRVSPLVLSLFLLIPQLGLSKGINYVDFYSGFGMSGEVVTEQSAPLKLDPTGLRVGYMGELSGEHKFGFAGGFDFSAATIQLGETVKKGRYNGLTAAGLYGFRFSKNFEAYGQLGVVIGGRLITTSLTAGQVNGVDFAHATLSIYEGGMGLRFGGGVKAYLPGKSLGNWAKKVTFIGELGLDILSHEFEKRLDRISSSREGTSSSEYSESISLSSTALLFSVGLGI